MNNILFSLFGLPVTLYALLIAVFILLCMGATAAIFHKKGWSACQALIFHGTALVLSLLLGRAIFCAVRYTSMFFDPMGRPTGWGPFFHLAIGNVSIIGILPSCLAAGWITARLMKKPAQPMLEAICIPLLLLFSAVRFAEPISGQGYGIMITAPILCWPPLSIRTGWGGWMISVSFMEGILLLAIAIFLMLFRPRKPGTRLLLALLLMSASQLLPESLRRDDALKLFTFARVNQMGFAIVFFAACVWAWLRSAGRKGKLWQILYILLSMILLIGGEFSLDKTQWPDGLIYGMMALLAAAMTGVMIHRVIRYDRDVAAG